MPEFIEETLGGDAGEVVVSFWSTQENVLEEIVGESSNEGLLSVSASSKTHVRGGSGDDRSGPGKEKTLWTGR